MDKDEKQSFFVGALAGCLLAVILQVKGITSDGLSVVIALTAIGFTYYSTRAARKHNRLSVRPVIDSWVHKHDHDKEKFVLLWIRNKGFGTAKIVNWKLSLDGKPITDDELTLFIQKEFKGYFSIPDISEMSANSYIAKDETITVIKLAINGKFDDQKIDLLGDRLKLEIDYESLYGEHYKFESD